MYSSGLHIIVEFIPNHTGTNHQWFQASRQSRDSANNAFWNYYVWADGQGATPDETPPNNWVSHEYHYENYCKILVNSYIALHMAIMPDFSRVNFNV